MPVPLGYFGIDPLEVAVLILGTLGIFLWFRYRGQLRSQRPISFAGESGFTFHKFDRWNLPERYAGLHLFDNYGAARWASDVYEGAVGGRPAFVFNYHTGKGYQALVIEMSIAAPRLMVRPAHTQDALAWWAGCESIEFESEKFNHRFHVKSDDPKFAYDVLCPRVIEAFLSLPDEPVVEMNGPFLLLYYGPNDNDADTLGDPESAMRLLALGREIVHGLPDYVRRAYSVRADAE